MFVKLVPTAETMLRCPVYLDKDGMFTLTPVSVSKTAGTLIVRQHKKLTKNKMFAAEVIDESENRS